MEEAFQSLKLGPITLRNKFIKSATYEGMYKDGLPTQKLIDHHKNILAGGSAMTTVSYGAVSPEGRTFKDQMWINPESAETLKELADEVQKAGGLVSMQLTHCGYFSKNTSIKKPLAPSRVFNAYGSLSGLAFAKAMDNKDLKKVKTDFVNAAMLLEESGFNAVEIHMGHGYLLSQFLSPKTNKRKDQYGGSIENRARFPLEIYEAVKMAVGHKMAVLVKLNLEDGFAGGFSLEDCKQVCRSLEELDCDGVVLSGGFTSKTPFYLMRGKVPFKGMIANGETFLEKLTMRLFGPSIVKQYPFEENFFLEQAKKVRAVASLPLIYLGGLNSRKGIEEVLTYGFDGLAMARPLIHDPGFVNKLRSNKIDVSGCNRCNECVVEMDRGGVRCVLN